MSAHRRRKTVISELPEEVKERILGRMPTRDAARCALLSTQWRDAWYRQGRLVFDSEFFDSFKSLRNVADKDAFFVNIINSILLLRAGPVKLFTLEIYGPYPRRPLQSELDRWCLFLSRNGVEELDLSMSSKHKLPLCLMSCKTMRQLSPANFFIRLPANARCIFPGLISANGNGNGLVNTTLPKLENLDFIDGCVGVGNFLVSAPQLQCLDADDCVEGATIRLLALHLISIDAQ
ncbi:unnamed protein product [Cuscuta europaea]|uniref:F-box domain-containing protein n=1 Tax=Cuscuta europaea TaxID=41803 RepID=A0A9P1A2U6_CUSEU|nr:unnamed protein product [Cuscuta europaea]